MAAILQKNYCWIAALVTFICFVFSTIQSIQCHTRTVNKTRTDTQSHTYLHRDESAVKRFNESDARTRHDLIECFSPFYNDTARQWQLMTVNPFPRKCDIHGIGKFEITGDSRKLMFMRSNDSEDSGKEYVMKNRGGPNQARIVQWLSQQKTSQLSTARSHPRYPFLRWKMRNNETQSLFIMERLSFSSMKTVHVGKTLQELSTFLVECHDDLVSLLQNLLKFEGKYIAHNDLHHGQVHIANRNGKPRCTLIDFDQVRSTNNTQDDYKHGWVSPIWSTLLSNSSQRQQFADIHGIEAFRQQGWDTMMIELRQITLFGPMLSYLRSTEGVEDRWSKRFTCGWDCTRGNMTKMWCGDQTLSAALLDRVIELQKTDELQNEPFVELVRSYSNQMKKEVLMANVSCT